MGTWGVGISSNDDYADIYSEFFELYNEGNSVDEATTSVIAKNGEMLSMPGMCKQCLVCNCQSSMGMQRTQT